MSDDERMGTMTQMTRYDALDFSITLFERANGAWVKHADAERTVGELRALVETLAKALKRYEQLDDAHANCSECEGLEMPETCEKCFPLADDARLGMRAALLAAERYLAAEQAEQKGERKG